jgi:predicted DNA-binding ribbon-helix-helix protein
MDLIVPQGAVVLVVVQVVRFLVRVETRAPSLRRRVFGLRVRARSLQLHQALWSRLTFLAHARAQAAVVVAALAARVLLRSIVVRAAAALSSKKMDLALIARFARPKFASSTMMGRCLVFSLRLKP